MRSESILRVERTTRLGELGEQLAEEALRRKGFTNVENTNVTYQRNFPYADIIATRDGRRYFIGVKTRNECRVDGALNESYNLVLINDSGNKKLKSQGKSVEVITRMLLDEIRKRATDLKSIPAWITVPVRPENGTYAVYFGMLADNGNRRSVPMTMEARQGYEVLANWQRDPRITPDLSNK